MITIRKSEDRGHADHGWLQSWHTFSFASYHDPKFMGFRSLRVINEDHIQPAQGFATHGHQDMEIISYMVSGALEHKDSMGNGSIIRPGEVQYMSAGTGVRHSEFNPSSDEMGHLLQIWILPDKGGVRPRYAQKEFSESSRKNQLCLVVTSESATAEEKDRAIAIHQDAKIYASILDKNQTIQHAGDPSRGYWLQVIKGSLEVNGSQANAGDAVIMEEESAIRVHAKEDSEFLLFDLK